MRRGGLDAIRVLAALSVFAFHANVFPGSGVPWPLARHGNSAVLAFFVLSGYLVYRPFLWDRVSVARYGARRAARIGPALLFALTLAPWALNGGLVVLWSLWIEIAFYLALPLLARVISGRLPVLCAIGAASFAVDAAFGAAGVRPAIPPLVYGPALLWTFALGMGVAMLEHDRPSTVGRIGSAGVGAAMVMVGFLGVEPLVPAGTALLVAGLLRSQIAPPWLSVAAELSYPFYLWHLTVLLAVGAAGLRGLPLVVVGFALALAVSAVSVRYVERPVQRLVARRLARGTASTREGHPAPDRAGAGNRARPAALPWVPPRADEAVDSPPTTSSV